MRYNFGDVQFTINSECLLETDGFTDRFRLPDGEVSEGMAEVRYNCVYRALDDFGERYPAKVNGMYELYRTPMGTALMYHWGFCRMGYGYLASELLRKDRMECWFAPRMEQQPPVPMFRFLSTAGLHSKLLRYGAAILHASYIDWNGQAVLFAAPAQTGKSTQAELWAQHCGADIINGDRVLLRRREKTWHAFGYPCCGSSNICVNRTLPLRAIVVLEQGQENKVLPMTGAEKVRALFAGIERYLWDTQEMDIALNLAQELALETDVVRLVCRPDAQAVSVLQDYLK